MSYTIKAPAKINIGLDVIRRRDDGYHDLKMIMQTVNLFDILTFEPSTGDKHILTGAKTTVPLNNDNLILRAANLLTEEFHITDALKISLEKNIPVAAGMAGGSADAAATMIAFNNIFGLNLSAKELMERGVQLGADVPYCIMKGTALSEGIGDILTPLPAFEGITLLIVKPPVNVSTAHVYRSLKLTPDIVHPDIDAIIAAMKDKNLPLMGSLCANILETVTIPEYPVINTIKETMLSCGADVSLMSGSGPTVFGIFKNETLADAAKEKCLNISKDMFAIVTTTYN